MTSNNLPEEFPSRSHKFEVLRELRSGEYVTIDRLHSLPKSNRIEIAKGIWRKI